MEDKDKILEYTKPVRLPDDWGKNRKNFTQGYFNREIGRYKNAVPSEFQWAAEDKLVNKATYEELKCQLPDFPRSTFLMVFSPDGKKVASTHGNHNVYVTDLTTGKNIQTLSGHPRTPWCIAFHPSSNQILASGCLGGQVRVWDLHGGSEVWTAESQTVIASLAFHPVDRILVIATYNELHFWDWSQPEPFAKCSTKSGREKVRYVSFDRLGNKLITGIANPVNVPSQWDRINVVNTQPPVTSTTETTTSVNTTLTTTTATTQSSSDQRSLTSWYRNFMSRYNQLVNMSRNTPTIDRGTDPMDLLDLRNNTSSSSGSSNSNNISESSTNNPNPSTSNSQSNPLSPLRLKITRSACRPYRPLTCRERFRIQSSLFRRLNNRSSASTSSINTTTSTTSSSLNQNSPVSTHSAVSSSATSSSYTPRLRRCALSLCPTARSWCLTLSPETSLSLFSPRNSFQSTSSSRAVTTPTYTSHSMRGILSTRETSSSTSDRSQFSVVRPHRLLFDDIDVFRSRSEREDNGSNRTETRSNFSTYSEQTDRTPRENLYERPGMSGRDSIVQSPNDVEIQRELQRPNIGLYTERQESESGSTNHYGSSFGSESSNNESPRNSRSSIFQLTPVDLRNVSPVRRFREDASSDGELTSTGRRESNASQSLMRPRPVPRFQVRSRLPEQQSQLHLLASRETHGLNLQNNQSIRRQLSFRPGGHFVLSRHSNSPFQPRVSHHTDSPTQVSSPTTVKSNSKGLRPEIPSVRSSFTTSVSSNTDEGAASTSSSNTFSPTSVPSNLSFNSEGTSRQLPEQINRRLFDRMNMLLRDRIRNSSENASTDSTVNYSRLSGESEADPRSLVVTFLESEDGNASTGLGPRGTDPMLSSASENLDTSNEALLLPNSEHSSPVSGSTNEPATNNNNNLNLSQSDLLDPWESESDAVPFPLTSPLPMNDILNEQPQNQESSSQETNSADNPPSAGSIRTTENSASSTELSMRQGIQLLSLHIENMQRLCLARIEILQLQKIRGMCEYFTNQIRYFHNSIQNRLPSETSSGQNDNSNSGGDMPSIRNLAISGSPSAESRPSPSAPPETQSHASVINSFKELVESIANELLIDCNKEKRENQPENSERDSKNSDRNVTSDSDAKNNPTPSSSRNETEEPQPGPSGISSSRTSRRLRNSTLLLKCRVFRLLREMIQNSKRRRNTREPEASTSGSFQRQSNSFRMRNASRARFRSNRHNRHSFDLFSSRSKALKRELEAIWQSWRDEELGDRESQPVPSTSNEETSQSLPSTSNRSISSDACQSCGQKKKPSDESLRQKRKSVDSGGSETSKALKNNAGERSEVPNREANEELPSTSNGGETSSQTQDDATCELFKQMLETMGTMLRFQREAFRRTQELAGTRSSRQQSSLISSDDDSDSDTNTSADQSESFMRDMLRNFMSTREVIRNSMQDIAHFRARRLLGFMIKSFYQFLVRDFGHLCEVFDESVFSLYMLLDLALEMTALLLHHLNARSRDLERNWTEDNNESTSTDRKNRNLPPSRGSTPASRTRDRSRSLGSNSYHPSYSSSREDNLGYRMFANPFLRSHSRLISSSTSHDRFSSNTLPSHYCRKKRRTARMSTGLPRGWYSRNRGTSSQLNTPGSSSLPSSRSFNSSLGGLRYRSFRLDRRPNNEEHSRAGVRNFDYEINNNSSNNDTNNNYSLNDDRNNNNNRNSGSSNNSSDTSNNNSNFLNYYIPNSSADNSNSESNHNNIIIVTGLNNGNDNNNGAARETSNEGNRSRMRSLNSSFWSPASPFRSMELTLSRNESGDLSLRDERPIFWIRYGGNSETSTASNNDSNSRVGSFTVPVVQVNDVPVSDVSMLNQPRHRPQSPVPRVPEDIWRWRAWRPRFLHPRHNGPNPFDDQDSNDVTENIHYYRILSTSGSQLGVYTLDPMIITDAPVSPHHRIQAWDFSKMDIPDISDREINGVVPECKIHNDASVDVSNDGHLLVTLLPSGFLSFTNMLGVYSLDWSSLGQLLYRTSFEQNAVSVSLSPTNRHLLVGLASRPVIVRDRTNMAQIFRLEGGRPSPHGGSWQSGRGRLVHMRDLEQTRETNIMSLNCIRWAPGAGQGLVYGTNTGQLKVLR